MSDPPHWNSPFLEETVLEVKRQSIIDLQKAVAQTEQKSNELLVREREQYQRLNQELKVQTFEEAYALLNRQDDGPEVRLGHGPQFSIRRSLSSSNAGTAVERRLRPARAAI